MIIAYWISDRQIETPHRGILGHCQWIQNGDENDDYMSKILVGGSHKEWPAGESPLLSSHVFLHMWVELCIEEYELIRHLFSGDESSIKPSPERWQLKTLWEWASYIIDEMQLISVSLGMFCVFEYDEMKWMPLLHMNVSLCFLLI